MDGVQPRAGTPPPWLDGEAGTGMGGLEHRCGDGMVVAPSMVGVLGDGMVDKEGVRWQILIDGLLGDEGDGIDHPPHP
ncbi:hypothetical protein QVD17_06480 [Tagetes erecta]|uniref:Uncharacterized protein n=1 Tax=Tagetes erecta TaxID=13708 RepID=A0AAD8LKQ7_TARER|nr:hypothetical protein QVD17_06480 [Tagetes erecta]